MNQEIFTTLLKKFTQFVGSLTESDLVDLIDEKKVVSIKLIDKKIVSRQEDNQFDFMKLSENLTLCISRDEVSKLLVNLKKPQLIELLKYLDIPIQSRDNISQLKEKVIESTVGYKLRSDAIQSNDE